MVNDQAYSLPSPAPARLVADEATHTVTTVSPAQGAGNVRNRCRLSVQVASAAPGAGEIVVAPTTLSRSISRSNASSTGVKPGTSEAPSAGENATSRGVPPVGAASASISDTGNSRAKESPSERLMTQRRRSRSARSAGLRPAMAKRSV